MIQAISRSIKKPGYRALLRNGGTDKGNGEVEGLSDLMVPGKRRALESCERRRDILQGYRDSGIAIAAIAGQRG